MGTLQAVLIFEGVDTKFVSQFILLSIADEHDIMTL